MMELCRFDRDFAVANAGGTKGTITAKVIAAEATICGVNMVAMSKSGCRRQKGYGRAKRAINVMRWVNSGSRYELKSK
jgi:hypothetical protein